MLKNSMKIKISVRQFAVLVFLYAVGTTILVTPSGLVADAKQDALIAIIIGIAISFLIIYLYNTVASLFPQMTFIEYSEVIFGKWVGKMISLLYVFGIGFMGATTLLFYVGNFMTTQIMVGASINSIMILFAIPVVVALRLGIETLARTAEILFPWFVVLYIGLVTFVSPQMEIENLRPVFQTGIKPVLRASLDFISIAALTSVSFFMIFPMVNNLKKAKKGFYLATFSAGVVIFIISVVSISVLGVELTERHLYPSYALARMINVGNFLQRIEAIVAALWLITIYFKLTLYFYVWVDGLARILKLSDYRVLILPMSFLLVVYSQVVYPNVTYMMYWDEKIFIPFIITLGIFMPLLLLAVYFLRFRIFRKSN
ncbi:endospore germination permease [Ammoniphilus sp. 3BR4]|uniref:GerAB/ArcD/ProY family transporter n=1 Tax=Ammoniphilus sp. 3BR4 TaxID=3158265 RepID=UPI003464F1A0